MKLYLASLEGGGGWKYVYPLLPKLTEKIYVLGSFFYIRSLQNYSSVYPICKDFMLDSGAFTFMNGVKLPNWEHYIENYADYIKQHKIQKFFELDIDNVVGYSKVKELRYRLEKLTDRYCIPVWHVSRGFDEFKRMCDEYPYVAVGGIVSKEITPDKYDMFTVLIKEAHKRKAKIHGLGFTSVKLLSKYHFDSVDSSSWSYGRRQGYCYIFRHNTISQIRASDEDRAKGVRTKEQGLVENNFREWIKFQKYAEVHL